jgi:broad-specificity NMP kinase
MLTRVALDREQNFDDVVLRSSTSLLDMRRVLVTGMSGTGKSTALVELAKRGFRVVETDGAPWSEWSEEDGGYVWRENLIAELLSPDEGATLYVSGTVSNQGRFYPRFDAVVLLSAPVDVLLHRIQIRTTNEYGKAADEHALILSHVAEVEPLLRATCTHEIDATLPIGDVVDQLVEIGWGE